MKAKLYLGNNPIQSSERSPAGQLIELDGEMYYQIADFNRMRSFFMSIVSSSDLWMFISSTGALTAGRRNPDLALFPYCTDDKIHDSAEITGSKTILIASRHGRAQLWEPFSNRHRGIHKVRRNLYKNLVGNKIIFEEINEDLALAFRYGWFNSERFGFVRKAWLTNLNTKPTGVRVLDGVQNLMPYGVGSQFQNDKSTLLDAYKRSELMGNTGLGIFRLSAIPIDRPEPAEALKATTVFVVGLETKTHLLSSVQLETFRNGENLRPENDVRAERGAYFVEADLKLRARQTLQWMIVADVGCGASEVAELELLLRRPSELKRQVEADVLRCTAELQRIVASADGIQKSGRPLGDARHFANVLCNVMRGGIFNDGYRVEVADLWDFIRQASESVATRHARFFRQLGRHIHYVKLLAHDSVTRDPQLERLCHEYLPLTFSRRHGDPSRPWNRFSIPSRNLDGSRVIGYEGNWRDIFQNWEALAISFPGYVASMVCKFVNASTADGYNPYRISRDGIDWEVVEPHDPWSFIGYWGDHQIIYLLRLLEILERHDPAKLRAMLTREMFCYANVPYRIKPYAELVKNPKDTVVFDQESEAAIRLRAKARGSDGKLIWDRGGNVLQVNLAEKLLVSLLAKISNFIPDAGIWLNTQRPEWNDANNALVGNGTSMVTVYYLRRMLSFCLEVFCSVKQGEFNIASEVAEHFTAVHRALARHLKKSGDGKDDLNRRRVTDELGSSASRYRERIYAQGFSGKRTKLSHEQLLAFFTLVRDTTDASIRSNRRADGLYHSYNLIRLERPDEILIRRLYEMLEGQVAVLSSGFLSPEESLQVLTALKRSSMYRADQRSYLLYPNRQLPRFTERNIIPAKEIKRSKLLSKLVADDNRDLVERDIAGRIHFNALIANARDVSGILQKLSATRYAALAKKDSALVLAIYERLFDHESFTGRSGTFFGYEGLGCIYWHMVSKLLLAAQETLVRAQETGAPESVVKKLAACYSDIREGIGDRKSPASYGGFPTDPYSHTPAHTGARQPGLTGQVKEDVLCRFGELGITVRDGQIHFAPGIIAPDEFVGSAEKVDLHDAAGAVRRLTLKPRELVFTYCQVTVIFRLSSEDSITVFYSDGKKSLVRGTSLDAGISREVFMRTGKVTWIEVTHSQHRVASV